MILINHTHTQTHYTDFLRGSMESRLLHSHDADLRRSHAPPHDEIRDSSLRNPLGAKGEEEEGGRGEGSVSLTDSFLQFLNENASFVRCPNEKCGFVFERVETREIPIGLTVGVCVCVRACVRACVCVCVIFVCYLSSSCYIYEFSWKGRRK